MKQFIVLLLVCALGCNTTKESKLEIATPKVKHPKIIKLETELESVVACRCEMDEVTLEQLNAMYYHYQHRYNQKKYLDDYNVKILDSVRGVLDDIVMDKLRIIWEIGGREMDVIGSYSFEVLIETGITPASFYRELSIYVPNDLQGDLKKLETLRMYLRPKRKEVLDE